MVAGSIGRRRLGLGRIAALVAPVALCSVTFAATATVEPDYAREERWAQEIVPAIVTGDAVYLATPSRPRVLALYTEPDSSAGAVKGGVIVVHGLGLHPDWGLVGALRTGLADAGFATLSVQMPVLATSAPATDYSLLFGASSERLAAALAFLHRRGIDRVAIVSHSMGSAMTDAFLAGNAAPPVAGWVTVGMQVGFAALTREPVLDVIAQNDLPQVRSAATRRAGDLPHDGCSRQVVIAGADHFMDGHYKDLLATVAPFLTRVVSGRC
jgi:alpha/beta superfamily hydrolase